jgi:pimeloyl-ACP methyl ester carboxylesterase
MSLLWSAARVAIIVYLIAAAVLYLLQDRLLLPSASRTTALQVGRHADFDLQPWDTGGQFAGYIVTPVGQPPRGTVVIYHGNAESADNKLPLASIFVHAGYRASLVEYPGYGRRDGARTMKTALAASRSALANARAEWAGPLFLVGESLGAGMAARSIVGEESSVAGVVLITPWDSLVSVAAEKMPLFPVRWMLHDPYDSVDALKRFEGPVVVVGAARDTLIPVRHAERLARLHPQAKFLLLPDADHNGWFNSMTSENWETVLLWMQR